MVEEAPPSNSLISTERIVNEEGLPTQYFLRQWLSQQGINTSIGATIDELNALALRVLVNEGEIVSIRGIDLIAGTGLSGGGDLSGDDRTFNLENTAVTPGDYGDATHVAAFTVDAQGRLTSASEVLISGGPGGGDNFAWPSEMDNLFSGSAFAFKGALLNPLVNMTITGIGAYLQTVAGETYKAGVYRIDGSDNIDQITGESAGTASPGTIAAGTVLYYTLTANLVAGSRYAVCFGRTDGADTFAMPISTEIGNAQGLFYPAVPLTPYGEGVTNPSAWARFADASPGIGTAVEAVMSADPFGVGFSWN